MAQGMEPHGCDDCDCQKFAWNGRSSALRGDPPSTCDCTHYASRHRFRYADGTPEGSLKPPKQES